MAVRMNLPVGKRKPRKKKGFRKLLPEITDVASARKAARQGICAALLTALSTGWLVTLELSGAQLAIAGSALWAVVHAMVFLAVAFGLWRMWRIAALAGLGRTCCRICQ